MSTKNDYLQDMRAKLTRWDAEYEILKDRAKNAAGSARDRLDEELRELKDRSQSVRSKLDDVGAATEDGWKVLREDVNTIWDDLTRATGKVKDAFQSPTGSS